jgi:hypothetical protein
VWAAALIVAALYGAAAGILALRGRSKVQQAAPQQAGLDMRATDVPPDDGPISHTLPRAVAR